MKTTICLAVTILEFSGFAQEQPQPTQPPQSQPQPAQSTPSTPPATTSERVTQGVGNIFSDYRLEDLPPAVQKTVREKAGANKISDIDRETRTGRTVWEIEIEQAGRNSEFHVADDGKLIPEAAASVGAPGGAQSGRSVFDMGTKWEELPPAVQQRAMQFGGKDKVIDIDRETENNKVEFEIEFRREGKNLEVEFAEDGSITESNDPAVAPVGPASAVGAGRVPSTQPAPAQPRPQTPPSGDQPRPN